MVVARMGSSYKRQFIDSGNVDSQRNPDALGLYHPQIQFHAADQSTAMLLWLT